MKYPIRRQYKSTHSHETALRKWKAEERKQEAIRTAQRGGVK